MTAAKEFEKRYKNDYIKNYYIENIQEIAQPGIDRIGVNSFNKDIDDYCNLISRKVLSGKYKFVPYKEVLILKGRGKLPRVISVPSIRDRLVLSIAKDLLYENFYKIISTEYIKKKIKRVHDVYISNKYDTFIKIDIKDFYGSLNHGYLKKKIMKKVRKKEFLQLLENAIKRQTINENENQKMVEVREKGVPQGLPISNIMANIYMIDFDIKFNRNEYAYFRYVDDILILCKAEDAKKIITLIFKELKCKLFLDPHEISKKKSKTCTGLCSESFSYLGYKFVGAKITVRKKSRIKIEKSIEDLFNEFNNCTKLNGEIFLWKLNLKITGGIFEEKSYGWLFYYSQINDETLLYEMDNFIKKLVVRYGLCNKKIFDKNKIKRFARTYYEINKNKTKTKYIPNFDHYTLNEKKYLLELCEMRFIEDDDNSIEIAFRRLIKRTMKELEKDKGNFS